ncbi:MAG: treY [Rhodospirillales bacterium]|nr:treY [Rhodospirillales bacterium]
MTPRATYRLQFHKDFTFDDAVPLAPYLAKLCISHVYSSPILTARAGSKHGYDVVDHTRINPELGGMEAFERLTAALKAVGIGIIVDIVPNHMAVGGADNPWWLDVLENGNASRYACFFDIQFDVDDSELQGKILAPFLGAPYGEVLQSGDLKLVRDKASGKVAVAYHHHRFPIRPEDREAVGDDLARYDNGEALHELLERQNFRLAWWRTAGDQINWRRFFDITELAGLRIERPEVFDAVHHLIFDLYRRGMIDGVRVDHVDGLADPASYCRTLRARFDAIAGEHANGRAFIVVEKILGADEDLPTEWETDGTTGYDFMNQVSELQHDFAGKQALTDYWSTTSGRSPDFESEELGAREEMLRTAFDRQLEATSSAFHAIAARVTETRDLTASSLSRALIHIIRHLRVYRTYATGLPGSPPPGPQFESAVAAAKAEASTEDWAIDFIHQTMSSDAARPAVRRFNQLTPPVAAKAVEDTAFYRYGRLLSRNDVGFRPGQLASSIDDFHRAAMRRAGTYPHAMLTTATHDHKRGEDSRARLAVLSEIADEWTGTVEKWRTLNGAIRPDTIAADDEYQLYQTLVGAWPVGLSAHDADALHSLRDRIEAWRIKSLREAKLRSSWAAPDQDYEGCNIAFLNALTDTARSLPFLEAIRTFVDRVAPAGVLNSLTQCVLRNTVPGVPDLYQGAEFWDFSLVDPDNRRPVDFPARNAALNIDPLANDLVHTWRDSRLKQYLMQRLLGLRANDPDLFAGGAYRPLPVIGRHRDKVVAFARTYERREIVVIAPIRCAQATMAGAGIMPAPDWWADTAVPVDSGRGTNVITDEPMIPEAGKVTLSQMKSIPAIVFARDV